VISENRGDNMTEKSGKANDNTIFVGKKPTMSYVLAVITQFSDSRNKEVHIRARGRSTSRAIDVAEVVKNKFMKDLKSNVEIGTEEVKDKENNTLNVSTINIRVTK
jgi:DNA-binding protein Alba